jgi:hypothetical protein
MFTVKLCDFTVWRHTWRKNLVICAVLTGNRAGLRTVLSSRLSNTELCSSLMESHSFLSLPADTTIASSQGTISEPTRAHPHAGSAWWGSWARTNNKLTLASGLLGGSSDACRRSCGDRLGRAQSSLTQNSGYVIYILILCHAKQTVAIHSADEHRMIYSFSNASSYSTFYSFFSSFRITLWPMWLANSKRQTLCSNDRASSISK